LAERSGCPRVARYRAVAVSLRSQELGDYRPRRPKRLSYKRIRPTGRNRSSMLICTMATTTGSYADRRFVALLHEQVRQEFTAHQQYTALAVWFDAQDLPQLAKHFYTQALEERRHAMMMVKYLLDRDVPVRVPGVDDVRNDFANAHEPIALALEQEKKVTAQV